MNLLNPFRLELGDVPYLNDLIDMWSAKINALWNVQHNGDGTHGAITAASLTVTKNSDTGATGVVTAIGPDASTFGGDVLAQFGTGTEDGLGVLTTVAGVPLLPAQGLRHGVLLGGTTNGHVLVYRPAQAPFNQGRELAIFHLDVSTIFPLFRFGRVSGTPTVLGGDGGPPISIGFGANSVTSIYADDAYITNGLHERNRLAAMGEWIAQLFSAFNFTASTGTWTVASGNVGVFKYTLIGKTLTVNFRIDTTSVSATPATLRIAIPGGFTAASDAYASTLSYNDNGTGWANGGAVFAAAGLTYISLQKVLGTSFWTASAGLTSVNGQLTLEIQ